MNAFITCLFIGLSAQLVASQALSGSASVAATKTGTCPLITYPIDYSIITCDRRCGQDYECIGTQKCCSNGCGYTCQAPAVVAPKGGACPAVVYPIDYSITTCDRRCGQDSECSGTQKCCTNGCGYTCQNVATSGLEKIGTCPAVTYPIAVTTEACQQRCSQDRECQGTQKCCSNGCGRRCMGPVLTVTDPTLGDGNCPAVTYPINFSACDERCRQDWECTTGQKCCSTGCGTRCVSVTTAAVKAGQCAISPSSTEGGCINQCTTDRECAGVQKCCRNACANVCVTPYMPWGI